MFILVGIVLSIAGVIFNTVFLVSALWGVFVGAIIPLTIMGIYGFLQNGKVWDLAISSLG